MTWVMPFSAILIFCTGVYLTIYFNWINVRSFKFAIKEVIQSNISPRGEGSISHFQALTLALSCTIGIMNISGVAIIIAIGGPGSIFWMVLSGFFGMTTKFTEATLGQKYRKIYKKNDVYGGTMYTIYEAFKTESSWYHNKSRLCKNALPHIAKILAFIYAATLLLTSILLGNVYQVAEFVSIISSKSINDFSNLLILSTLSIVTIFVVKNGVRKIAAVLSYLMPIALCSYVLLCAVVIFINLDKLLNVILIIMNDAFTFSSVIHGFLSCFLFGTTFGAFSNEAGLGTSSVAHANAISKEPVKQGLVALLEPFIDTLVICTLSAFVILLAYPDPRSLPYVGVLLTKSSITQFLPWVGPIFDLIVTIFVLSTILSTFYYGERAWKFIFSRLPIVSHRMVYLFVFVIFIFVGNLFNLIDLLMLLNILIPLLVIPNLFMILNLKREIKIDLKAFLLDEKVIN